MKNYATRPRAAASLRCGNSGWGAPGQRPPAAASAAASMAAYMRWFCARHRLAQFWADARIAISTNNGDPDACC